MNIVLTGASGFLGSEIVAEMVPAEAAHVTARGRCEKRLSALGDRFSDCRTKLSLERSDVREPAPLPDRVDIIIHAAALRSPSREAPNELYDINVEGTKRMIESGLAAGCRRFVLISTQAVYGTDGAPWSEDAAVCPETPYAISKREAEKVVLTADGLQAVVLRLSRLYGVTPLVRWSEIPGRLARDAALGEPLIIFGTGEQRFDLVHVRDAARAVTRAALRPLNCEKSIYNVGGGGSHTINEIYQQVEELAREYGLPSVVIRRNSAHAGGTYRHLELRIDKIRHDMEWKPQVSLRQGIEEYIACVAQTRVM